MRVWAPALVDRDELNVKLHGHDRSRCCMTVTAEVGQRRVGSAWSAAAAS